MAEQCATSGQHHFQQELLLLLLPLLLLLLPLPLLLMRVQKQQRPLSPA
jgi:hypothetical protein